MKILALIKTACTTAGVDEKHAERIQKLFKIDKEEGIDSFVALFKENVLPAVVEAETTAKTNAEKAAKETAITEYETTHKLKDGKPVEDPDKKVETVITDTMDPALKAMQESIEKLTGIVTGVVKTSTNAQKLESVKAKLAGKVEAKYIDRVAGKVDLDAEDLDAAITAQVTDHTEFVQSLMVDMVGDNYVQPTGKPAGEKSVEEWGKIMNSDSTVAVGTVDLGLGK